MIERPKLLANLGDFSERDYLEFLASRIPPNVVEEVTRGSALNLIADLDSDDVLVPLREFSFSRGKRKELDYYFDEVTMGLVFHTNEYHPYVAIYLCSVHLHLYASYGGQNDMRREVTAAMVNLCLDADAEARVHVLKFLLWLSDEVHPEGARVPNWGCFLLLAVSVLWCSVLRDLVHVADHYATEGLSTPAFQEKGILATVSYDIAWRALMERVFGSDGQLLEVVDRCHGLFGRRGYKRGNTEGGRTVSDSKN